VHGRAGWIVVVASMAAVGVVPTNGEAASARAPARPMSLPPGITQPAQGGVDVSVTGQTPEIDDEPTVAVDPSDPSHVVVGAQHLSGPCTYYESSDGGLTWSQPHIAPLTKNSYVCYDIVARASPDGRYFYVSYLSIKNYAFISDVAVLRITTDFSTVRGPIIAIHHRPGGLNDKDWINVHEVDPSQANTVYVAATYFRSAVGCSILFVRSSDYGITWSKPVALAKYPTCTTTDIGGIGARALGSLGSTILACWYGTGDDGWGPNHGGGGTFDMICRTSLDDGDTWGPIVFAVKGEGYELPYSMCPNEHYERVWSSMIPGMAIGPDGSAHLTYATDPTRSNRGGECADVRYVRSSGAPYDTWSAPVTIAGGAEAQSFSAVTATLDSEGRCRVDVAYMNGINSPSGSPNRMYDLYRISSTDCGLTWSSPERVSDVSSIADKEFVGDYIDMAAASDGTVHLVWTDRRFEHRVMDPGSDVYTDQWSV
jgi:hypothetical protein